MCIKDVGKRRPRRLDKNVSDTSPSEVSIEHVRRCPGYHEGLVYQNQAMILFEK